MEQEEERDTEPHRLPTDVRRKQIPCTPEAVLAPPDVPPLCTTIKSRVSDIFANILLPIAITQIILRVRW